MLLATLFFIATAAVIFIKKREVRWLWLSGLSIFILVGAFYYGWDDAKFHSARFPKGESVEFSGIIANDAKVKEDTQEFVVQLSEPFSGRVLLKTARYPQFEYGDMLRIVGKLLVPSQSSYALYLEKERISASIQRPQIVRIGQGGGLPFFRTLFQIKHKILDSFQDILPAKEAALLSGITLGDQSAFSADFKNAMKQSGTTHLVALSGYNITILLWVVISLMVFFVRRRAAVIIAFVIMCAFVLATGAEASVVRAAIMGAIVLVAGEWGRVYDIRNAVMLAALLMALQNPKVLLFDVGFQLSFLALLGIVYLKPALQSFMPSSKKSTFLSFQDNFFTTVAAQLAVIPVLILNFGNFSLVGVFSNLLVLEVVPLTMGIGFLAAGVAFLWQTLAVPFGWLLWILLRFQIMVIEFFGNLGIAVTIEMGAVGAVVYYTFLVGIIIYAKRHFSKTRVA